MDDTKVNSLVNIGQSKVAESAYNDLASPPSKKVGQALSTIIDIGNTVLWPVKWLNERTRLYFESNLKKYESKLENIEDDKIVPVPTEISKPILERFTYVSNEELSRAFVALLSSASSADTISIAHPGFIAVIDRLSPDEAKILKYFKLHGAIPRIDIKCQNLDEGSSYFFVVFNETGIESEVELTFPSNASLYLDNLISVGLIQCTNYFFTEMEEKLNKLVSNFDEIYDSKKLEGDSDAKHAERKITEMGMYRLTSYGSLFVKACIE